MERRLAAVMSADVVGYSRLMREEEARTHTDLKACRSDVIDPTIAEHRGRLVKLIGDGALVEFASVVDALNCAVAVQRALAARNADLPAPQRIELRIGINIGDVIVEGDDIYGDGVCVAARLESLAEPGGICISGTVHEHTHKKLDVEFENLGEHMLKNIDTPVRVYAIRAEDGTISNYIRGLRQVSSRTKPSKPSIVVLPFHNLNGDSSQDFFVDGIAEDIITALSRFHWFFVISRHTSLTYRGVAVEAKKVALNLGVRYVLEGSVRTAGNKVRITAQLIDARNDHHLWAEHYDRALEDIFAVQDEITDRIIGSVAPGILAAEMTRAHRKDVESLDTWERIMCAHWHLARMTPEDTAEARRLLTEAAQIEANSALALGDLAMIHGWDAVWGWGVSREQSLAAAAEAARRAVAIDESCAWGHIALALVDLCCWRVDEATGRLERAVDLSPNDPSAHGFLGLAQALSGDYAAAMKMLDKAVRLSPRDPFLAVWHMSRAVAAFTAGKYEEAVYWSKKSIEEKPLFAGARRVITAALGQLGRLEEARAALDGLLQQMPGLTIKATVEQVPLKRRDDLERYIEGLRRAGLPE